MLPFVVMSLGPLVTPIEFTNWLPNVGIGSGWVILGVGLATGRLMTRRQHDEQMEAVKQTYQTTVDATAHDANEWRAEGRIKDQVIVVQNDRNFALLEKVAETVLATFDAIKDNSDRTGRDGDRPGGAS